jgi:virginiamycin A acetyltransferase
VSERSARELLKAAARAVAWIVVTPSAISYALRSRLVGRDRALEGSTQAWALVPGIAGQYLRRAFLARALDACAASTTIEFGTIFSSASARIEDGVYIGPRCHIGWAHIEQDALVAAGVHIPSGPHTHGSDDLATPMREQHGRKHAVRIGPGAWIGSAAVVMADVGREAIVGAGAVVTRPIPDRVVAGGVPARVLRSRERHPIRIEA